MTGNVVRNRSAIRDLDQIADFLQTQSGPNRAIGFLRKAESTFQRLASLPQMGAPFEYGEAPFAGLRYCPISRFRNYVVFYRPMPGGIEVLRVLHGSRDLQGLLNIDLDDEADDEDETPVVG